MEDLKQLSLSDLIDLLVEQTNYHAHLRALDSTTDQLMISREILRNLQGEIELRKLAEKTDQSIFPSQKEPPLEMAS
jgi:hypothetical protein